MTCPMPLQTIIVHQHPFVKAVAHALRHRCGLRKSAPGTHRAIVATSGGADSVALLRSVAALSRRRGWRLSLAVGHVQHHLRDQAEDDARFVEALAQSLNLPFLRADLTPPSRGNLEAWGRAARYESLAAMARQFNARYVVTAHHGDDQLETLLMRLLRGGSVTGLSCMAWRRRLLPKQNCCLLRPMLAVDREAVGRFLADLGQPWCEDHTNADRSRLRARLRQEVLPVLRDIQPGVARRAVRLTGHLRSVASMVDRQITRAAQQMVVKPSSSRPGVSEVVMDRRAARRLTPSDVVLTGVLRKALHDSGVSRDLLSLRVLAPIARATLDTQGGQRAFQVGSRTQVLIGKDTVRIRKEKAAGPNASCVATGPAARRPTSSPGRNKHG